MNKERLKSITLVGLILMNFVLGGIIMTDKKLWPHGYNFFISLENSFPMQFFADLKNRFGTVPAAKTHLSMPENIIINTGYQTTRFSVNAKDPIFSDLTAAANKILASTLSASDDLTHVDREEWYSALTAKSVYLSYPVDYEAGLFAQFLGVKNHKLPSNIRTISKIVISTTAPAAVYLEDSATSQYYRLFAESSTEPLLELISTYQAQNDTGSTESSIINYSFDLRFDQAFGGQKAILSPMIPIYSNPQNAALLSISNPLLNEDGSRDEAVIDRILKVFSINPTNARRYTEADGTIVFVENNGILKIDTNGLLSYTAKGTGTRLSRNASTYNTVSEIADLVDSVSNAVLSERNLYVSSPLTENTQTVTFDYLAEGLPVQLKNNITGHAVTVETENGRLLRYEQLLRRYTPAGMSVETPAYINALDDAIATYSASMNEIVIDKMYLCYTDTGTAPYLAADWAVQVRSVVIGAE